MNGRDLAELVFKIWGAVVLVTLLTTMPADLIFLTYTFDKFETASFTIVPLVTRVSLGLGLILFARSISRLIIPLRGELALQVSAVDLRLLSFALMGLWLMAYGAGQVSNAWFEFEVSGSSKDLTFWEYLTRPMSDRFFWNGVIDVLAGLWLFFGGKSIERLWSGSRSTTALSDPAGS